MSTNYENFLSGAYCNRLDAEVLEMIARTEKLLVRFNTGNISEDEKHGLLEQMLGSIGRHTSIGKNFTCQCGKHIFLGEQTIVNMNCTMMDENFIRIGNRVLIAPNVQFYTATHPVDACERFVKEWDEAAGELFFRTRSLPITIGNDVWIGGGAIILPGVTIGDNCVIGAGSVVNKSIPANSVAAGNPCRVIRQLIPATESHTPELNNKGTSNSMKTTIQIHHVALYVNDLEKTKEFFIRYFNATSNEMYHNPRTGLKTYLLSFGDAAKLEIMTRPELTEQNSTDFRTGYIHLSFSVGSRTEVDLLTSRLEADGYTVASQPRVTGDGFYESCVIAPEGNLIEITE